LCDLLVFPFNYIVFVEVCKFFLDGVELYLFLSPLEGVDETIDEGSALLRLVALFAVERAERPC
jgi:hypothetical protein